MPQIITEKKKTMAIFRGIQGTCFIWWLLAMRSFSKLQHLENNQQWMW